MDSPLLSIPPAPLLLFTWTFRINYRALGQHSPFSCVNFTFMCCTVLYCTDTRDSSTEHKVSNVLCQNLRHSDFISVGSQRYCRCTAFLGTVWGVTNLEAVWLDSSRTSVRALHCTVQLATQARNNRIPKQSCKRRRASKIFYCPRPCL